MRVLNLTLKGQWFDLVSSGVKRWEYREYKPHWQSRLLGQRGTRDFDEVRFTHGYGAHRPFVRCEFLGVSIIRGMYCEPDNGEQLDPEKLYFVIALGAILERGNTHNNSSAAHPHGAATPVHAFGSVDGVITLRGDAVDGGE